MKEEAVAEKRNRLLRLVGGCSSEFETAVRPTFQEGMDWRADYRRHLLEKSLGEHDWAAVSDKQEEPAK